MKAGGQGSAFNATVLSEDFTVLHDEEGREVAFRVEQVAKLTDKVERARRDLASAESALAEAKAGLAKARKEN